MEDEPKPYKLSEQDAQPVVEPTKDNPESGKPDQAADNTPSLESNTGDRGASLPDSSAEVEPHVGRLGIHLARAMQEGGYYPVILFGTNSSGKTSLLLSLLATLISEPHFETGLVLCDPILGTESGIGRLLHSEARKLFEVMTQAFLEGEPIPHTRLAQPFFVPVELRPKGKPPMRLAFLESNGEWYRPNRGGGIVLSTADRLYAKFKPEIEDFITSYQGGMTFIYLAPYTQAHINVVRDGVKDADEIESASVAIAGAFRTYDRIRAIHRADDQHLILVTKWDARSTRDPDRFEGIQEDRGSLNEFSREKYSKAISALQSLNLSPEQGHLNAYCAGLINDNGLLQLKYGDDVRDVIMSYPIKLWSWLYKNALIAADLEPISLVAEPPKPPTIVRFWNRLLDFVSAR